jgi:hypothetical protein
MAIRNVNEQQATSLQFNKIILVNKQSYRSTLAYLPMLFSKFRQEAKATFIMKSQKHMLTNL